MEITEYSDAQLRNEMRRRERTARVERRKDGLAKSLRPNEDCVICERTVPTLVVDPGDDDHDDVCVCADCLRLCLQAFDAPGSEGVRAA